MAKIHCIRTSDSSVFQAVFCILAYCGRGQFCSYVSVILLIHLNSMDKFFLILKTTSPLCE